ncbi:mycothiol synthase [Lysinibacter sp. HNR]|uniref:mycothiol synthase n=1 Tax=Lysinibacter sp. HNR TaxID=3031408 RepID=UPI002434E53A|nr:mycothiol synthase [Lysinibacter sp. HNR]WGD38116.1 mycothiol synthase [Lysinibacter sp. HNR]
MTKKAARTLPLTANLEEHQKLVNDFVSRVTGSDGIPPFSDQGLVDWKKGAATVIAIPTDDAESPTAVRGIALYSTSIRDRAPSSETPLLSTALELSIAPTDRGMGLGTLLLHEVLRDAQGEVLAWAHGHTPAAQRLAQTHNFKPIRTLLQLSAPVPELSEPPANTTVHSGIGDHQDITLRAFKSGQDERAWIELNAVVFADHPEQGQITVADLLVRESEPWFSPGDFILAIDQNGTMLGYNWLKVTPGGDETRPSGEIYAIGVSPDAAGRGLGRRLLDAGIQRLRDQGVTRVTLYVEGDNTPALSLYRSSGFETANTSVHYRREAAPVPSPKPQEPRG